MFILAYCVYVMGDTTVDHYIVHDTQKDALEAYDKLVRTEENLHSASVFGKCIVSTDYPTHDGEVRVETEEEPDETRTFISSGDYDA